MDKNKQATIPKRSQDWFNWLSTEEEKTKAAYHKKPALLIADYNRERAIARDYEGRELLELLQNANDQAAELGARGRVLIELSEDGLIVANTGLPFSTEGVASLQTSHLSPKRHARRKLIGNKGLGFRSILNWTSTPLILSDALCIAFSGAHAGQILEALKASSPELERLVQDEATRANALIVPILQFPLYSPDGALLDRLGDPRAQRLFERSEELIVSDYNTVVAMPFKDSEKYAQAAAQMAEMRPEILLFAENLGELCFRRDGVSISWSREGDSTRAEVKSSGHSLGQWQIFRSNGPLPPEIDDAGDDDPRDYEIVVALPVPASSEAGLLYSHFPTDVSFPLAVVCHATLDLEQARKHLLQGRQSNAFVLRKLAEFLADIAERVAIKSASDPWAGCSIVRPTGDFPVELKRDNFPVQLVSAAKGRCIVPTLGGVPVRPDKAMQVPGASSRWLPTRLFAEVVPVRGSNDSAFLSLLEVPLLAADDIKARLVQSTDLTLHERVNLITGLLQQDSLKMAYTSALFIDSSGVPLGHDARVFLSPSSGHAPSLPPWAELRFLSEPMRYLLAVQLHTRDSRELQQKLTGFGLTEYSLANVISALVAEANRAEKASPAEGDAIRLALLKTVYELYDAEPDDRRPSFPERSALHLPNQAANHAPAASMYLGIGFGTSGETVQSLYGTWAPHKLIDRDRLPQLTPNQTRLAAFLLWTGAAMWPREITEPKPASGFLSYVINGIRFPAQFEDKVVTSVDAVRSAQLRDVPTIDGLDQILDKAEADSVVAWLANDDGALGWSKRSCENGSLVAYPDGVHRARVYTGPLPNYARWRIENTNWLRSSDGISLRPKDCVLGERATEELFPRPAAPGADVLARYGLDYGDVLQGWQRAGVLTSLAYLEHDEIYAKLLELPHRSPDGKLARPLYHWLLDASESAIAGDGPNRKRFLAEGKMWGFHGKHGAYFSIHLLHHTDVEGLPEKLLERLNIVHLRKRAGAEKVERLFGVKPVDRAGIQRRIISRVLAVGSTHANSDLQDAKPYLHKLRVSQTTHATQLQSLKNMQLEVCSSLTAELTFEGVRMEYQLPLWGWLIEGGVLSVRVDPGKPLRIGESLLADSIGEALASVFRIADGGDFARLLTCEQDDRLELLRRLGGETILEGLDTVQAEYAAFKARDVNQATFPLVPLPKPLPAQSVLEEENDGQGVNNVIDTPTSPAPQPKQDLVVAEVDHVPSLPRSPRTLQIKKVSSHEVAAVRTHDVTDGDLCELKATEFEESCEQMRWPLPVAQIMGANGPGCDILSFSSAERLERFKNTRDLDLVCRFIEVKGRGNSSASIELKGNELSAAEQYQDRYFLYRLSQSQDGEFQLSILQNPLSEVSALQPAVHVVMQRAVGMQRYSLTGGIQSRHEVTSVAVAANELPDDAIIVALSSSG